MDVSNCDRNPSSLPDGPIDCENNLVQGCTNENEELLKSDKTCSLRRDVESYGPLLKRLRESGERQRSDRNQPSLSNKPAWLDESLFNNAKKVYARHFMGMNFAHLSGLLMLVRIDSIFRTLSSTGESDSVAKLFHRYYNTIRHVKNWYEGDIFDPKDPAHQSLLVVRGMHNKVCSKLNDKPAENDGSKNGTEQESRQNVHLSEYDIMITQFAFLRFIITKSNKVGLITDFSDGDLESLLHFWRVIGYYLGVDDSMNLCSYELKSISGLCEAITEMEAKEYISVTPFKSDQGIMSINIVRSVKFIPMLTVYGILKYIYEILDYNTTEIEKERTPYSRLSYVLIKLVMTSILAYRPMRSFNNGLTRLSIYCIGKIEGTFSNYLQRQYGPQLSA